MADAEDESTDVWRQGRPGGPGSRGVSAGGGGHHHCVGPLPLSLRSRHDLDSGPLSTALGPLSSPCTH